MIFINQLLNENMKLIPKVHEAKEKLWLTLELKRSVFSELDLLVELGGERQKQVLDKQDLVSHFKPRNIESPDFWDYFLFFNSQNDYYLSLAK
jgi:hypothetical protein